MPKVLASDKTARETRNDIFDTVERWNAFAGEVVISSWDTPAPAKVGGHDALLRVTLRGQMVPIGPCNNQPTYDLNLRACYLALEGMRLNEQRGLGEIMRGAYAALPAPDGATEVNPYDYLGVNSNASRDDVQAMVRSRSQRALQNETEQKKINLARDAIFADKGWK